MRLSVRGEPKRLLATRILAVVTVIVALAIAWLKWQSGTGYSATAGAQAVEAADAGAVAILSYQPDTVEQNMAAAQDLLTAPFKDEYAKLAREVVIPGAKQRRLSSMAAVSAAAPVTVSSDHAVVLVFVNQTTFADEGEPKEANSSVRITLENIKGRWLISAFDPV